jgi:hypothetical protein
MAALISRRARLVLTTAIALLLIAGCGGSTVAPSAYVKSVCTALGSWKNTIQSAAVALESSGASTAQRSVAKQDYQRFVASLVTATRHAAGSLRAAGTPSVSHGKEVAARLTDAFDRAAQGLEKASSDIKGIRTDSAGDFQLGFKAVSAEIRSALESIARVSPGQNQELRSAAAKEPACRVLA